MEDIIYSRAGGSFVLTTAKISPLDSPYPHPKITPTARSRLLDHVCHILCKITTKILAVTFIGFCFNLDVLNNCIRYGM